MSDRPIQVGDLVQIVRPMSCGCVGTLGFPFIVDSIEISRSRCDFCGEVDWNSTTLAKVPGEPCWVETYRLKRIPPLEELEGVEREEKEPA